MQWNQQARLTTKTLLQPLLNSSKISLRPSLYAAVFQFFTGKNLLKQGQQLHAHITLLGLHPTNLIAAKMVAMYASSGDISSASQIFHITTDQSTLLYNSIIRAFSLYKMSEETLGVFNQMRLMGFRGDNFTYPFVLKSVSQLYFVQLGKGTHGLCKKVGLEFDMYVGTSLIDMYVKCCEMKDARKLFDELPYKDVSSWNAVIAGYMRDGAVELARDMFEDMPVKNIVSWTSMISGYTQNGLAGEALHLFDEMLTEDSDVKPNWVTVMSVLPACSHSSALDSGKKIHRFIQEKGLDSHPSVQTALVAMFAKCGSLIEARRCFDRIRPNLRNLVAWNTMITAYSSHGLGKEAVSTFDDMIQSGVHPDGISFTGLLSGCSHSGLVDIGLRYFDSMSSIYSVERTHEHYACTVDLLGRAGRLVEAYDAISRMPMPAGASVWGSLLSAGKRCRNLEISEFAAKKLFLLEPENSGNYVLLSNMYAEAQMWDEVKHMRALAKMQCVKKNPGCSWIEIDGKAHLFLGGDTSHVQTEQIYLLLEELPVKMRTFGYVSDTSFALHDVSEEEKEQSLATHSEKLAVAFGLLNTSPGTILRVTKNLRICGDCHTAIKFISTIYEREIVVRDVNRFHHFNEGSCSCGDYW